MIKFSNYGKRVGPAIEGASAAYYATSSSGRPVGTIWKRDDGTWIGTFLETNLGQAVSTPMRRKADVEAWMVNTYCERVSAVESADDLTRLVQLRTRNGARASAMLPAFQQIAVAGALIAVLSETEAGEQVFYTLPSKYVARELARDASVKELDVVGLRNRTYLLTDEDLVDRLVEQFPIDLSKGEPLFLSRDPEQLEEEAANLRTPAAPGPKGP